MLQRVLNCASRIVFKSNKYDHITPLLRELHWLPIQQRIEFKILLITFKALNKQYYYMHSWYCQASAGPRPHKTISPPLSSYLSQWNKKAFHLQLFLQLRSTVTELMCSFFNCLCGY